MSLTTPRPITWVLALVVLVTMLVYLWPVTPWSLVIAPLSSAAVLFVRQLPVMMTLVLIGLQLMSAPLGVSPENPAALAPMLIAVYALGRYSGLWRGIAATVGYLAAFLVLDFTVGTIGFVTVVLGGVFTFGVVVRHRDRRAHTAQQTAETLAATDIAVHAARVITDERARIGGQCVAVIRNSVDAMRADAAAATSTLDQHVITAIADRGRVAIAELRRLLGLLRGEVDDPEPHTGHGRRLPRGVIADGATMIVLIALTVLDGHLPDQPTLPVLGWALLLALPTVILLRRVLPVHACLAATSIIVAIQLTGTALFIGFGVGPLITIALLAWSVAVDGRPVAWLALVVLAAVTVLPPAAVEPGNAPMQLAIFVLPAVAGHEWTTRDRERRRAESRAMRLRHDIDRHVEAAIRAERLRMARELHDVTSHAVGVMTLQASAASATRLTDPDAARAALRAVESVGGQALAEVTMLFELLDAGAIGTPGLAGASSGSIEELVDRMRAAGLHIELIASTEGAVGTAGRPPAIYRVVQESLTNVARHAPKASARVEIRDVPDGTFVRVTDDGDSARESTAGAGFGLAGLAERVRASGGVFTAGPMAEGGFEVCATVGTLNTGSGERSPE